MSRDLGKLECMDLPCNPIWLRYYNVIYDRKVYDYLCTCRCESRHFFRVMILVIACLIVIPALSVSFFDRPDVTHTLSAGVACQPISLGAAPRAGGMLLRRVTSMPFVKHCEALVCCGVQGSAIDVPHRRCPATTTLAPRFQAYESKQSPP